MASKQKGLIRAIRLELKKPLDESWETIGPHMHALAWMTPKLLNEAMDTQIAIGVVGTDAVKAKIAPDAKAATSEGIAYQAVLRKNEALTKWKPKGKEPKNEAPSLPGAMSGAIARAAAKAYARRDQGRVRFSSKRILVRADSVELTRDERGFVLKLGLRAGHGGHVRFAIAASKGTHYGTLRDMAAGKVEYSDCKLQYDASAKKWYALLSYEVEPAKPTDLDPNRVLVVHRGVRNALYVLASSGQSKSLPGGKFVAQRRALQARTRDVRHISADERGAGAKGHGRKRRYENYEALGDKIKRVTHTFCQQSAAFVAKMAKAWGCGQVVIEDYGGIEPDPETSRVLERFPLYEMKQCIKSRLEREGIDLAETTTAYISTSCPRCSHCEAGNHNRRTGIFHCRVCKFERAADWVACYWMLANYPKADMSIWNERLKRERELAEMMKEAA